VTARVYMVSISNPSHAALAMVRHKRLPHRVVMLAPGFHPALVRAAGFPGWTVPALDLDGRRAQGSLAIAHMLDELHPERPLYPADPDDRRAVAEAEEWGERELQPVPRRLFRRALLDRHDFRRWMVETVMGWPAPALAATVALPVMTALARSSGADRAAARRDVERLPALLDRVDALIADGTIGSDLPNAADYQIASSVRLLHWFADLREEVDGRPCERLAARLFPRFGLPIPQVLPAGWR
jgi:glutathione S-transferase